MADLPSLGKSLHRAFAQPDGQNLPPDFLRLLGDLDRAQRPPLGSPRCGQARE
ncbi:hypothetical protein [Sphingomonas morindae]|uniref:Anti-sigma factor NepR domain-containing protein n=1 Tax=Sphingomonas morindae TaxID=1541170 RepID=A0ABY4XDC3_9SPHN|nr:hypothetical protein [Sphingomonas morindae]USI74853.1 hypothetical protein LHA26_16895 [Sphingomonas morindae]